MSTAIPEEYAPIEGGITLYTLGTPNGVKVSLALSILNIEYKTYSIDISKNTQKAPWFLEHVNPNGRIPAIIDKTHGSTKVFESGAILLYLAEKYDKDHKISYEFGTPLYFEVLEWLFFQNAGVGPMQGQAHHFALYAPEKIHYGIKRYTDETRRLYSVLETRLKKNGTGFLVGDHVSVADLSTVGWVGVSAGLGINIEEEFPETFAWVGNVIKVPGAVAGLNNPVPWRGFSLGPWKQE